MDNLTHTVIGLIAGESVAQGASRAGADAGASPVGVPGAAQGLADRTRRTLLIAAFTIGGNLPDLDLLASYRGMERGKLEYMLQHRGYTHTVLGCIVLGLLLYGALALFARWRHLKLSGSDRRLLLFAALAGTLLHLFMDFLNSYGVHPFWPLDNRWYYGDSVFIVEPLYWIAAAPLFFVQRSWPARAFVAIVVGLAIVLSVLSRGMVPVPFLLAEAALAAVLFVIGRRLAAPAAAFASLAVSLGGTAVFIVCGGAATAASERLAAASERLAASAAVPAGASRQASNGGMREYATLADHVLSPLPANPFCWDMILIQEHDGHMRLRHGMLSVAPMFLPARKCPARSNGGNTAPLVPVPLADTESVRWLGELAMPAGAFAALAAKSCSARSLMQFARAPFLAKLGETQVIGDLRFDREPGLGFSELAIRGEGSGRPASCPRTPPWTPPRAELLDWPRRAAG